jgi:hypothetical protein
MSGKLNTCHTTVLHITEGMYFTRRYCRLRRALGCKDIDLSSLKKRNGAFSRIRMRRKHLPLVHHTTWSGENCNAELIWLFWRLQYHTGLQSQQHYSAYYLMNIRSIFRVSTMNFISNTVSYTILCTTYRKWIFNFLNGSTKVPCNMHV